jgi:hypothetical protein
MEMSDNTKALTRPSDIPDLAIEEFGTRRDIAALSNRIRAMMPGGEKLTPQEAMATAQYALTLGANPFRGEIYAYQDRGKLQIVEGYKLLVRWAKRQCDYSEWYTPMDNLPQGSVGFWCHILRDDKKGLLDSLLRGGMELDRAMDIVTTTAGGVVRNGDGTAAPKGWTLEDVAKKRALKNALNKSHGVPSLQEIADMSWRVHETETQPEDWAEVTSDMTPNEAAATAEYNAKTRKRRETPPDITAEEAIEDLYGDVAEAEYVEPDDLPPMPEEKDPHAWTPAEIKELTNWFCNEIVITDKQALEYLSVSKISEFPGDIEAAKAAINAQIAPSVTSE